MDENAALQAKIAALSGQIKQRREAPSSHTQSTYHQSQYYNPSYPRGNPRWAPYNRGGRAGYPGAHRNRTLVVGGVQSDASSTMTDPTLVKSPEKAAQDKFVSTRGPGKSQLMTKETYNRELKQKTEYVNQQDSPQRNKRPQSAGYRVNPETVAHQVKRELMVDGIRFQMADDGSKLFRIPCELSTPVVMCSQLKTTAADEDSTPTPKTFKIADVTFIRTKHGNLVRAKSIEGSSRYKWQNDGIQHGRDLRSLLDRNPAVLRKPQCEHFTKYGTSLPYSSAGHASTRFSTVNVVSGEPVGRLFSLTDISTGNCPFGPSCRFTHDPRKVSICKDFLRNGSCPAGKHCDLSHEPTYHRVPACTHFLRGNCTNSACRYPHVHVSPAAPVCRPFATLGYCAKGPSCPRRHVIECPDYSNRGQCANREKGSCPLPHVDRAHALRKAAKRQGNTGSEDDSDISSGDEEAPADNDAIEYDSDGPEDFEMSLDGSGHELTQQQDFIAFG